MTIDQATSERFAFTGTPAISLGIYDPDPREMMFVLYLPIKMIDSTIVEIPDNLRVFVDLVVASMHDFKQLYSADELHQRYVYLTAKQLFITPDNIGNRPGYHCDGFGSDDINYLWCDKYPTVFNGGDFFVRKDDLLAVMDMEDQAKIDDEYTYDPKTLIRVDSLTPHRTPKVTASGLRTFVKISFSRHRYNLEGNAHNYAFDYDWTMYSRTEVRNKENKDYTYR